MILAPIILALFNSHNLARGSFIHCCVLNFSGEANTILGYMNCKILCSGLMSVNIICGLFYLPITSADSSGGNANDQSGPRCSLKLKGIKAVLHACSSYINGQQKLELTLLINDYNTFVRTCMFIESYNLWEE